MTLSCVLCLLCAETLFDRLLEAYLPLGLDSMLLSPLPRCDSLLWYHCKLLQLSSYSTYYNASIISHIRFVTRFVDSCPTDGQTFREVAGKHATKPQQAPHVITSIFEHICRMPSMPGLLPCFRPTARFGSIYQRLCRCMCLHCDHGACHQLQNPYPDG